MARWHDAVFDRDGLRDVGAEPAIEDDDHAAVIAVKIAGVAPVMHAVVRGRVEDIFDPARQATDRLGMHEELIEQVHAVEQEHHTRRHAEPHQRQEEQPPAGHRIQHALSHRGGEIHPRRAVMHDMRAPEPADPVAGAMEPVIVELDAEHDRQDGPSRHRNVEQPEAIDQQRCRADEQDMGADIGDLVQATEIGIQQRLAPVVADPAAPAAHDLILDGEADQQDRRDGNEQDALPVHVIAHGPVQQVPHACEGYIRHRVPPDRAVLPPLRSTSPHPVTGADRGSCSNSRPGRDRIVACMRARNDPSAAGTGARRHDRTTPPSRC